jgi:hypothetical protein
MSARLTTKPGLSWQRIGVLPSRAGNAYAVTLAWCPVSSGGSISTGGLLGGGLLSGMLAFLPRWGEWALLLWLAGSMYGILLLIGYHNRPFWEEQGPRW